MISKNICTYVSAFAVAVLAFGLNGCSANSDPTVAPVAVSTTAVAVPNVTFVLTPAAIDAGKSTTATWTSSGATSCTATGGWSGAIALNNTSGTAIGPVSTAGTYTYGVNCSGPGGATAANQILMVGTVPAPVVQMSVTPAAVMPGNSVLVTWSSANATSCTASGGTGSDGWSGTQAIENSTGFSTGAIATAGEYTYTLSCTGDGGTTERTSVLTVSATAAQSPPAFTLAAHPAIIQPGQATSFTWNATGATSCAASGGSGADSWRGVQPTSSTGTSSGNIAAAGTYSFTLTCAGPGGNIAKSVNVIVSATLQAPPPSLSIHASPAQIVAGGSASLIWSSSNVDSCLASGSWSGSKPTSSTGTSTGTLTTAAQYSYTLTCAGAGGSTGATAAVTVNPAAAVVASFTATPLVILTGQSTVLAWLTDNATSCTASGGTGSDHWGGTVATASAATAVGPFNTAGTYVYTLLCAGPGGEGAPQSISVRVNAAAPLPASVVGFSASPSTILVGQSTALNWSSNNATSCTATGGPSHSDWTGSVGVSGTGFSTGAINTAGSYIYTLTCTGPGGTGIPGSAIVNVTNTPPTPASIVNFVVAPTSIQVGQSASLSWSTDGATSCTAGGGSGADLWVGLVGPSSTGYTTGAILSAGVYSYTLVCTGPGGTSATRSAMLNVSSASPSAASVGTFIALPTTVTTGQSTTLSWVSSNAASCTASGGTGTDHWGGNVTTLSLGTTTGALSPAGTYTYTLVCTGAGGSAGPSSVSVTVADPPTTAPTIDLFTATPSTLQVGQASSLAWLTSGATACIASGGTGSDGWAGAAATGSIGRSTGIITTANSYTYTLTCTGPGGTSIPSSVVVNVNSVPPPAASVTALTAVPSILLTGQSTSIAWSSSSATSCTASGGSGADAWTGSVGTSSSGLTIGPLNVAGNFVYTLTCTGPGGTSAATSVTVDVNSAPPVPTIGLLTAIPTILQVGQSTQLSWLSTGATSCTASGGWSGSKPISSLATTVGPLSTVGNVTFTLTCAGAGGTSVPSSVTVAVTAAPVPATIRYFQLSSTAIQTGQATTLTWASDNATVCTAGGGTGSDGWLGAVATSSTGRSTGAINVAGTYTYTLTCTGAGGSSALVTDSVTVSTAPPAAAVNSFVAIPIAVQVGQSTQLSWTSSAASACAASGGTGSDGWSGAENTASTGTPVGPFNRAGNYVYTLICTGPGGSSAPASITVTASAPVAASILSFIASPTAISVGQSASLSWSTLAATSCTATGGSGTDGWGGTLGSSSLGTAVGPLTAAATVTYTLTCTGAGGTSAPSSASVTVNATVVAQPTVTLTASSTQILPGSSATLTWSSTNATSCTASGGSATEWQGTKAISGSGVSVGPVTSTPGIYSYTLTCAGAGGTGSSTIQLTVMSTNSTDCGVGFPTTSLVAPAASATGTVFTGPLGLSCAGCSVNFPQRLVDTSTSNFATMIQPVAVTGTTSLQVNGTTLFPAGRQVGFVMAEGTGLLNLSLLQGITIETLIGTSVQQTATYGNLLTLQAAGALSVDPEAGFASFTATKPFNSVAIIAGSLASVGATYKVYGACVALQ